MRRSRLIHVARIPLFKSCAAIAGVIPRTTPSNHGACLVSSAPHQGKMTSACLCQGPHLVARRHLASTTAKQAVIKDDDDGAQTHPPPVLRDAEKNKKALKKKVKLVVRKASRARSRKMRRPACLSPPEALRAALAPTSTTTTTAGRGGTLEDGQGQHYIYHPSSSSCSLSSSSSDAELTTALQAWLHPTVLQRRVRAWLVQYLLLSTEPLTPQALIEAALNDGLDATTRYMADWSAYAAHVYAEYESMDGSCVVRGGDDGDDDDGSGDVELMRRVGKSWVAVLRYSALHVARTGLAMSPPSSGSSASRTWMEHVIGEKDAMPKSGLAFVQVLGVIMLLSDPYFRVSAHSGFVCYPALPSTLLLTSNMAAFSCPTRWLPSGQNTRPLDRPAPTESKGSPGRATGGEWSTPKPDSHRLGSCVNVMTALSVWESQMPTPSGHLACETPLSLVESSATEPGPTARTAAALARTRSDPDVVSLCDHSPFLWLSDVCRRQKKASRGTHTWTYMHSLWRVLDALRVESSADAATAQTLLRMSSSPSSLSASPQSPHSPTQAMPSGVPHDRRHLPQLRGSGSALVDAWLLYLDANTAESTGCFAGLFDQDAGSSSAAVVDGVARETGLLLRRGDARWSSCPTVATWDAAQHGALILQDWVREAASTSAVAPAVTAVPLKRVGTRVDADADDAADADGAGAGTGSLANLVRQITHPCSHHSDHLHRLHTRTWSNLLTQLVAVPVTVSQLATALRWNVSVAFAPDYDNSLLSFLLETAANPQIHALYRREQRRRRAREQLIPMLSAHRDEAFTSHLSRMVQSVARDVVRERTTTTAGECGDHTGPRFRSQHATLPPQAGSARSPAAAGAEDLARELRVVSAVPSSLRSAPPLVTPVVVFRILDRAMAAASSSCASHALPPHLANVASRAVQGQSLMYVERLDTAHYTPQEVHAYLAAVTNRTSGTGASTDVVDPAVARLPYSIDAEASLVCMPMSTRVLDRRFRLLVLRWQQTVARTPTDVSPEVDASTPAGGGRGAASSSASACAPITVGCLAQLSLWGVEYPPAVASEMLASYLSLFTQHVRLSPPTASRPPPDPSTLTDVQVSFKDWTVQFL